MEVVRLAPPHWGIRSAFSPLLVKVGHAIPGMQWSNADRAWVGYPDAIEATVRYLQSQGLRVDDKLLRQKRSWGDPIVPYATKNLRPYQVEGVKFLIHEMRSGALLADWMGLGKTATTITAIRALKTKTVVVCPNYVRGTWKAELAKWWPGLSESEIFFPKGSKPEGLSLFPETSRLIVIHYDIFPGWLPYLQEFEPRVLVIDEGHVLGKEGSKRSDAIKALGRDVEYRALLTGTPLVNRPADVWNVVDTICPGRFGANFFGFGQRYCDGHKEDIDMKSGDVKTVWNFKGASNLDELAMRLDWFMLRRTKHDVKLQIPPKTRDLIWVETRDKAKVWAPVSDDKKLLRAALEVAADAKLPETLEILKEHLDAGDKVVVYCYRQATAETIHRQAKLWGFETELLHGSVSAVRRGVAIDRARNSDPSKGHVIVCTIDAVGMGIDLSYASVGIVAELMYEPHKLLQMEARQDRFGQQNPVLFKYILQRGSVDEFVANIVVSKLALWEKTGVREDGKEDASLQKGLGGIPSEEDILAELYGTKPVRTRKAGTK